MKVNAENYTLIILVLTAVVILFLLVYKEIKAWIRATLLIWKLKGPQPLPIIGNALLVQDTKKLEEIAGYCHEQYGSIFRAWICFIPAIFIYQPHHLQAVLGSNNQTQKNFLYSFMHNFIGEGLITNNGYKWSSHRKYIQSRFGISFLEYSVDKFVSRSARLIEDLKYDGLIKITSMINDCVLDILHEVILDIPEQDTEMKNSSPFRTGKLLINERITKPWMLSELCYRLTANRDMELTQKSRLRGFTRTILEKKLIKGYSRTTKRSLLDILVEISKVHPDFTQEDVVNEACTFMLAGQDSVASAICFTLYYLAKHEEYQQKAREEVDDIFEECGYTPRLTHLNDMKYLGCCIKEALRLCPSVPIIARRFSEDLTLDEYTVPAGCNVFITPYVTHRLPHLYSKPDEYIPDRFLTENETKRHPYSYIPFSAGPRNCLGYKFAMLEIKAITATILRHFNLSLDSEHDKVNLLYRITLRAKGGIWLKMKKR